MKVSADVHETTRPRFIEVELIKESLGMSNYLQFAMVDESRDDECIARATSPKSFRLLHLLMAGHCTQLGHALD